MQDELEDNNEITLTLSVGDNSLVWSVPIYTSFSTHISLNGIRYKVALEEIKTT